MLDPVGNPNCWFSHEQAQFNRKATGRQSIFGNDVKELFSCSIQLSIKFKLLINDEIAQIN